MSSNFANSWQKHAPGNWKQTHTQPTKLRFYVRTVGLPCKYWYRFYAIQYYQYSVKYEVSI